MFDLVVAYVGFVLSITIFVYARTQQQSRIVIKLKASKNIKRFNINSQ